MHQRHDAIEDDQIGQLAQSDIDSLSSITSLQEYIAFRL
jgi:hypothetical protein